MQVRIYFSDNDNLPISCENDNISAVDNFFDNIAHPSVCKETQTYPVASHLPIGFLPAIGLCKGKLDNGFMPSFEEATSLQVLYDVFPSILRKRVVDAFAGVH